MSRHRRFIPLVPTTPPTPRDLQAVFVYGTLRPQNGHPAWAAAAEVAPASPGVARGRLYHGPGFPYFVQDDSAGYVRGDVLLMDRRHPTFDHMRSVEFGAGYHEIEVDVLLDSGATVRAVAFNADPRSVEHYGTPERFISDGDWLGEECNRVWNRILAARNAAEAAPEDEEDDDEGYEPQDYDEALGHDTVGEMRGER